MIERPPEVSTVGQLIDEYIKLELPKLKPRTQQDRRTELGNVRAVFGDMAVLGVEPRDIVGYKQRRRAAPIRCNRELSALSALFPFAVNYCAVPLQTNPCREVPHFPKNPPWERCPEAEELETLKRVCVETFGDHQTALYIDLKRAIGLRLANMLKLHLSMIQPDGLRVDSGKRGKKHYFPFWDSAKGESTGLNELITEILELPRPVGSLWVFCTRRGQPYTVEGFQANWQRRIGGVREGRERARLGARHPRHCGHRGRRGSWH
jgi:integrase